MEGDSLRYKENGSIFFKAYIGNIKKIITSGIKIELTIT
jgi:hypothetical protein